MGTCMNRTLLYHSLTCTITAARRLTPRALYSIHGVPVEPLNMRFLLLHCWCPRVVPSKCMYDGAWALGRSPANLPLVSGIGRFPLDSASREFSVRDFPV